MVENTTSHGYTAGEVRKPFTGEPTDTEIDYGAGAATDAQTRRPQCGIDTPSRLDTRQEPGQIRVTLGPDYTLPPGFGQLRHRTQRRQRRVGCLSTHATPDRGQTVNGGGVQCVD